MKIEIKRSTPEKEECKYPYLGVEEGGNGVVVWFVKENQGIAILATYKENKLKISTWFESNFIPVKKLTVEL